MDEIFSLYGAQLEQFSKQTVISEHVLKTISEYAFENGFNVYKLGIFLAYCHKLLEIHPSKKQDIYEQFFKIITNKIRFN